MQLCNINAGLIILIYTEYIKISSTYNDHLQYLYNKYNYQGHVHVCTIIETNCTSHQGYMVVLHVTSKFDQWPIWIFLCQDLC